MAQLNSYPASIHPNGHSPTHNCRYLVEPAEKKRNLPPHSLAKGVKLLAIGGIFSKKSFGQRAKSGQAGGSAIGGLTSGVPNDFLFTHP